MTKRFKLTMMSRYGHLCGVSDGNKEYTSNEIVDLLNEKNDLIENLRIELKVSEKDYQSFNEILKEANDLICSHLSKHYQRKWKTFCQKRGVDLDD